MNRTPVPNNFQSQPQLATERQVAFISDLMDRKDLFAMPDFFDKVNAMDSGEYAAYLKAIKAKLPEISKKKASETIERLLSLPNDTPPVPAPTTVSREDEWPSVPSGRYAIERDGVTKFYRVDKPDKGRWVGYTFVKAQASDELHPIRHTDTKRAILAEIAKDPNGAMARYGQELGHCGRCGRTLTDETSRELGIGPVCRGEMGL